MIGNTIKTKVMVGGSIMCLCEYNKTRFVVFNGSGKLFKVFNDLSDADNFLTAQ